MDREFLDEKGVVGRKVLTMMQSPKTELLREKRNTRLSLRAEYMPSTGFSHTPEQPAVT